MQVVSLTNVSCKRNEKSERGAWKQNPGRSKERTFQEDEALETSLPRWLKVRKWYQILGRLKEYQYNQQKHEEKEKTSM